MLRGRLWWDGPPRASNFPSGDKAAEVIEFPRRTRSDPSRATAPTGRGSPEQSVRITVFFTDCRPPLPAGGTGSAAWLRRHTTIVRNSKRLNRIMAKLLSPNRTGYGEIINSPPLIGERYRLTNSSQPRRWAGTVLPRPKGLKRAGDGRVPGPDGPGYLLPPLRGFMSLGQPPQRGLGFLRQPRLRIPLGQRLQHLVRLRAGDPLQHF